MTAGLSAAKASLVRPGQRRNLVDVGDVGTVLLAKAGATLVPQSLPAVP